MYFDGKKFMENCKISYTIRKSKRMPRLSQIEIDGQIDEDTRKKLIKEISDLLAQLI